MAEYDIIVLGTGGVGSAAMYHAAKRGARVLGLDRFPPGHDRGSSHGQTRVIRQAYFEHVDYVPLLIRAYALWADLEVQFANPLFFPVGLLEVGPADGEVAPGVLKADSIHRLGVQTLSRDEVARRYPPFQIPESHLAVFEPQAGYLLVESAVVAHIQLALAQGAEHRSGVDVHSWRERNGEYVVATSDGEVTAAKLILAAGAWTGPLLEDLAAPLRVLRKHLHWYRTNNRLWRADRCPTFLMENEHGVFYGFPEVEAGGGIKVAEHSGGELVDDPRNDDRSLDPVDAQRVEQFIAENLRDIELTRLRREVCYYTVTPDFHFIVDRHPQHRGVAFAAGLSGHGFKFAPVLGEVLTELVLDGGTEQPIGFLSLDRPSLRAI